jgi:molecular chaperone GrpE
MVDRKAHGRGRDREVPPAARHSTPSGPSDASADSSYEAVDHVDPELVSDLGAEFELRGDQLEEELTAARNEAAEWQDKALRAQADFANTRRRLEASHADALLRAGERIVENLLPVLDDMDRAIEHAVGDGSDVAEGLDAVRRKLLDVLAREGCSAIDPFGQPFEPLKHNAVQMREDAEVPDHTVVDVFQKGYEMHGRVLRPAMVVVSTGGAAGE